MHPKDVVPSQFGGVSGPIAIKAQVLNWAVGKMH